MNKKVVLLIALILTGVAILATVVYLQTPKAFLTEEEIMEKLYVDNTFVRVEEIQEIVPLDEKSMFVPFITNEGKYGSSFWMWRYGEWEQISLYTSFGPVSWTSEDGTKTYLTWNIHPDDKVDYFKFYLISDRYFQVSYANGPNRIETYLPKIQMDHKVPIDSKTYGAIPIPEEWEGIIDSFIVVNNQKGLFTNHHNLQPTRFARQAFDDKNKEVNLKKTIGGGGGGSSSGNYIQHIGQVNDMDLE